MYFNGWTQFLCVECKGTGRGGDLIRSTHEFLGDWKNDGGWVCCSFLNRERAWMGLGQLTISWNECFLQAAGLELKENLAAGAGGWPYPSVYHPYDAAFAGYPFNGWVQIFPPFLIEFKKSPNRCLLLSFMIQSLSSRRLHNDIPWYTVEWSDWLFWNSPLYQF